VNMSDENNRLRAEITRLRERAERAERARDALIKASLTQHSDGRWGAFLGNYAIVAFDSRDTAIREMLEFAGLDAEPAADPAVAGLVAAFGLPGEAAVDPANPSPRLDLQRRRMTRCQADEEEPCEWEHCPQVRDGEPKATGRHCPFDVEEGGP
jgi:hypothetical protein